jgi:LPS export ABC transporter permease LptG
MAAMPGVHPTAFARPRRRGRRAPILDVYILKEIAAPFAFGVAAIFLFWFANIFVLAADSILNKGASPFLVMRFLLFRIPQATPYAFPFGCLCGTLVGFGRLVADNELTAMRTAGITFKRIMLTPFLAGLAVAAFSFFMNEKVAPVAVDLSTRSFYQIVYRTQALPIEPNIFRTDPSTGNVYFIGSASPDGKVLNNVQIFSPDRGTPFFQQLTAASAHLDGSEIVLEHPVRTRVRNNGIADSIAIEAQEARIPLPLGENNDQFLSGANADISTMDAKRLADDIHARKVTGQGGGADLAARETQLSLKYAYPFASLIAVILAVPLAVRFGNKGRAVGVVLALAAFFAYYLLGAAAQAVGRNASDPWPYIAAWVPNVLMGGVGLWLALAEDR